MKNWKKISIVTLGILTILGTCVLASTGTVNAPSGLVLRQEASTSGTPITTLPDDAQVEIIEKVGDWYKVTYNSQEGYAYAEYIEVSEEPAETPVEEPTEEEPTTSEGQTTAQYPKKSTTKNTLSVYNIPLITSTVINKIEANTEITIYKQITNWSYVSVGNIQGWVRTYGIENEAKPIVQEEIPEQTTQPEEPEQITEPETPENVTEEPADNTGSTETTATINKAFINVDYANVRSKASTDSSIVTTLTKNTSFTVTAETEEWYKIKYTAIDGIVYEGYIYKELTIPANS